MIEVVNCNFQQCDVPITRYSIYGNPFTHLSYGLGIKVDTREESIRRFAIFWYAPMQASLRRQALRDISKNARLGCVCFPKLCHGDIIAGYLNWKHYDDHIASQYNFGFPLDDSI